MNLFLILVWEQRKLCDIFDRVVRKNTNNESKLPLTISAQYGLVDQTTYFNNRVASRDVSSYYLVLNGEFAYNKSTSDGYPFGAIKRLDLYEKGVLSTLYIVFAIKDDAKFSSDYLTVFFDTNRWHRGVAARAAEGARNHGLLNISAEDFFDIDIQIPSEKVEQDKLGAILRSIDNLITLHQRKFFCKKMKNKVFLIINKMANDWEQRKLEYWFDERNERSGEGELISVTINSGIKKFSEINRFDSKPEDMSKYKVVRVGDIAYNSMRMWQGASGLSPYNGILSPAYTVISPKINANSRFFAFLIKKPEMIHLFEVNSQGLTKDTWNLKFPAFSQIEATAPFDIVEQGKIAVLLEQLDNLITLHQRKEFGITICGTKHQFSSKRYVLANDWEQRKLGEKVPIIMGQSPDGSTYTDKPSDYILVQGNADLENGWVKPRIWTTQKTKCGSAGDLIMSVRAPAGTMGKTSFDVVLGRGVAAIKGNEFIYQLLIKKDIEGYWKRLSAGSTFESLNSDTIYNSEIVIPEDEEQEKIGHLFELLDNLITLHQCKDNIFFLAIDAFKIIKMKENMTNAWEQRKVRDVANRYDNLRIPVAANLRVSGSTPYYGANGIQDYVDGFTHEGEFVLVAEDGANDLKNYPVNLVKGRIWVNNHAHVLQTISKIANNAFLAYSINQADIESLLVGGGRAKLNAETLMNIEMPFAALLEQEIIGEFLASIDNLITLHQRKEITKKASKSSDYSGAKRDQNPSLWEQREVGELLVERNQKAPMSEEYPLMAFIANEGVTPKGERYDRSALVTDTENKLYKKTEFGDFIYSSNNLETGSIGLNKYGKASISPVYSIFEPTGIADSDFLGRRLVRKDFINSMVKWRQGVIYGQWRIHESDFIKIEIAVPRVEEQRKIGALLDQLDNLITLHQRGG